MPPAHAPPTFFRTSSYTCVVQVTNYMLLCFRLLRRLFSSAHFNDTFPQHSPPEILNTALEGVVLAMKALGVDRVGNFPFPTQARGRGGGGGCLFV